MTLDAKTVMEFRADTNLPLMQCKEALLATNGDKDLAKEYLRKKGVAFVSRISNSSMPNGTIGLAIKDHIGMTEFEGTLLILGCQTDFVAINSEFIEAAHLLAANESVDLNLLINKFRENIAVTKKLSIVGSPTSILVGYNHGKIAAIVSGSGPAEKLKNIALHIVASAVPPIAVDRSSIPQKEIDVEREIVSLSQDVIAKPEKFRSQIIEGKLNKNFFKTKALLENELLVGGENSETIDSYCKRNGLVIESFIRLQI